MKRRDLASPYRYRAEPSMVILEAVVLVSLRRGNGGLEFLIVVAVVVARRYLVASPLHYLDASLRHCLDVSLTPPALAHRLFVSSVASLVSASLGSRPASAAALPHLHRRRHRCRSRNWRRRMGRGERCCAGVGRGRMGGLAGPFGG